MSRSQIVRVLHWGILLAALMSLAGCGGGTGSDTAALSNPAVSRDAGAVSLRVPPLENGTRLLPTKGAFIKIEILDTILDTNGVSTQTTLQLYDAAGAPVHPLIKAGTPNTNVLFDVINRTDPNTSTTRTYGFLPIKSLLLRVGAYKNNPADPQFQDATANPPLATALVPFVPGRKNPDGTLPPGNNLSFTLNTAITALELHSVKQVNGSDTQESSTLDFGGTSSPLHLFLVAKSGDAIALQAKDFDQTQITWAAQATKGADAPDAGVSSLQTNLTPTTKQGYVFGPYVTNGVITGATLDGTSNLPSVVRVTATDKESGLTAVREITLTPKPGFLNLSLQSPPFGTRSVVVTFQPKENRAAPAQTVILPWQNGTTLMGGTASLPLTPGYTDITVLPNTGDNGDGVPLTGNSFTFSNQPVQRGTTLSVPTIALNPADTGITVVIVAGADGNPKNPAGFVNGAYTYAPFAPGTPLQGATLIAGQTYTLEVRSGATPLPGANYRLIAPTSASVQVSTGSSTRFLLQLNSEKTDISDPALATTVLPLENKSSSTQPTTLLLQEAGDRRQERPITFAIRADIGGSGSVTIQ